MRNKNLSIIYILLLFMGSGVTVAEERAGHLVIRATELQYDQGVVIANLFRVQAQVLKSHTAFRRQHAPIARLHAELAFSDIPQGDYAVIVFHDQNNNQDLDHHFLGFSNEPMGFSNGFRSGLLAGLPSFQKLKFKVNFGDTVLSIPLQ